MTDELRGLYDGVARAISEKRGRTNSMKRIKQLTVIICIMGLWTPVAPQAQSGGETGYNPNLAFAQVEKVIMEENADGTWNFAVTVRHDDSGWDHYADKWQIVAEESSEVLGERVLVHPHTEEQPFTRSLRNVEIPEGIEYIRIRAKCSNHGYEGKQVRIPVNGYKGVDWVIHRNW